VWCMRWRTDAFPAGALQTDAIEHTPPAMVRPTLPPTTDHQNSHSSASRLLVTNQRITFFLEHPPSPAKVAYPQPNFNMVSCRSEGRHTLASISHLDVVLIR
jgi:hypothetical protein